MPVRPNHIVVDADDLPGLARFWTQPLDWKVLPERERDLVIGTDEHAPRRHVLHVRDMTVSS